MNTTQEINTTFSTAANLINVPHDYSLTWREPAPGLLGWLHLRWVTRTEIHHYDPEIDHPFIKKTNLLNSIRTSW